MTSKNKIGLIISSLIILIILFLTFRLSGHRHSLGLLFIGLFIIDFIAIFIGLTLFWTKLLPKKNLKIYSVIIILSFALFLIYHRSYDSYNETRRILWGLNGEVTKANKISTCDNISQDKVCVTIINASGQTIKSLVLKHEKQSIKLGQIDTDSQTAISFKSPGENSYTITAFFNNGDSLKSSNGYIEGGYKLYETITPDTILRQYNDRY